MIASPDTMLHKVIYLERLAMRSYLRAAVLFTIAAANIVFVLPKGFDNAATETVEYCDLIKDQRYDGKVVCVRGIFTTDFEASTLESSDCPIPEEARFLRTWIDFDPAYAQRTERKWRRALEKVRWRQPVEVVFVGRYEARRSSPNYPGQGFGHMDMYSNRLLVTAVQYVGQPRQAPPNTTLPKQTEIPPCKAPIEYGHKNQVDYGPLVIQSISGQVLMEVGNPSESLGPIPACLGIFTEDRHILVASTAAEKDGRFKFPSITAGRYRLVVRDPQAAFCVANVPILVTSSKQRNAHRLVVHMRPAGIDDCSYGVVK